MEIILSANLRHHHFTVSSTANDVTRTAIGGGGGTYFVETLHATSLQNSTGRCFNGELRMKNGKLRRLPVKPAMTVTTTGHEAVRVSKESDNLV